tara:strand:+ start:2291 stop:2779 length:489 start_codon:yes stop_codon:yes gene_type:complete
MSEAEELGVSDVMRERESITFDMNTKCWSFNRTHSLSFFTLVRDFVVQDQGEGSGEVNVSFDLKTGTPLYYMIEGRFLRIGLKCKVIWKRSISINPISIMTYEQLDHGPLAWVIGLIHESPVGPVEMKMPLVKEGDAYRISHLQIDSPEGAEFSITMNKVRS